MNAYPNFEAMEKIETTRTVAEAIDRFYKRDRLNNRPGAREAIIANRESNLREDGHAILASRHDNTVGHCLWLKPVDGGFEIYASK
jgi:hypothetical protein